MEERRPVLREEERRRRQILRDAERMRRRLEMDEVPRPLQWEQVQDLQPLMHPSHLAELNAMLLDAMSTHDHQIAARIIRRGADPNIEWNGSPILHYAIIAECLELVICALHHGANAKAVDRDGDRMMHLAVEEDFREAVVALLRYEDINCQDENGNTSIFYALYNPKLEMLKFLLNRGANINAQNIFGETPLHVAVTSRPRVEVVRELLKRGASVNLKSGDGQTPLQFALSTATVGLYQTKVIIELITHGADVNDASYEAFHHLVSDPNCDLDLVRILFLQANLINRPNRFTRYPLHYAVETTRVGLVKLLCKNGAEVNVLDSEAYTPMHLAAACMDNEGVIAELIGNGASVNMANRRGYTPLHVAVRQNNTTSIAVNQIIAAKARINALDHFKRTPLHYAVESTSLELVKILCMHNADVNALDIEGQTPLHLAVGCVGNEEVVAELLAQGAKPNAINYNKDTPLHVAVKRNHTSSNVVEQLLIAGSDSCALDRFNKTPFHYVFNVPNHPAWPILLQYSILENFVRYSEFPHNINFWIMGARFLCDEFVSEIERMRMFSVDKELSLFDVVVDDKFDITHTPAIVRLMTEDMFPLYSEIVLHKLAAKVKNYLLDSRSNISPFLLGLSYKLGFNTNFYCLFKILSPLSNRDCLNLYLVVASAP